jgi:hypothetical protein
MAPLFPCGRHRYSRSDARKGQAAAFHATQCRRHLARVELESDAVSRPGAVRVLGVDQVLRYLGQPVVLGLADTVEVEVAIPHRLQALHHRKHSPAVIAPAAPLSGREQACTGTPMAPTSTDEYEPWAQIRLSSSS